MSLQSRRYDFQIGCIELREKPWYIDVMTFILALAWMGWSFTLIKEFGPSAPLIAGCVVFLLGAVMAIHDRFITHAEAFGATMRSSAQRQETEDQEEGDGPDVLDDKYR